jgi:hypothetical protein
MPGTAAGPDTAAGPGTAGMPGTAAGLGDLHGMAREAILWPAGEVILTGSAR